jgi:hypothetical protein
MLIKLKCIRLRHDFKTLRYYHALDPYGNPTFVTEKMGSRLSSRTNEQRDLFNYVESELKAVETLLADPRQNEYESR